MFPRSTSATILLPILVVAFLASHAVAPASPDTAKNDEATDSKRVVARYYLAKGYGHDLLAVNLLISTVDGTPWVTPPDVRASCEVSGSAAMVAQDPSAWVVLVMPDCREVKINTRDRAAVITVRWGDKNFYIGRAGQPVTELSGTLFTIRIGKK